MAEMTEAKIYEALGLEMPAPADTGANVQEPAEPAQTQTESVEPTEGANEQEPAEPADGDTTPTTGAQSEPQQEPDGDSGAEGGSQVQTPEERRANAARRRQQEQQQAVDAAVAAARREEQEKAAANIKELFEKTGMKNTITGEPITTMEQLRAWQQDLRRQQLEKDLKAGKLTPEGLNQLIEDHPAVQQARQMAQQQTQQPQTEQQKAVFQAKIDGEMAEISKMDPTIKTPGDLLKMPKAKEFYAYVQKGYSFLDSYKLTHIDEIGRRTAEAARQQAQASVRSKEHLKVTGNSRDQGAASVPAADMQIYRMLNPNVSEADIQKHYNNYQKRGG